MTEKIKPSFYENIALFPLFTIVSAYLATLFWGNYIPAFLTDQWVLYSGIGLLVISVLLQLMAKLHLVYVIDVFLVGCLFIWVVYWQKEYTFQAPVFESFSLYFVLINLLFGKFARNEVFAEDQHVLLDFLNQRVLLNPILLAICVLVGLYAQTWYMLFPIFTSMLMISILLVIWTEKIANSSNNH
ncbi:MAG: hypothetical protein K0U68_05860 [Gammaproteobacteria bacterium]|nr:hypothetical protein [Gammaproteobacteria bacterium]